MQAGEILRKRQLLRTKVRQLIEGQYGHDDELVIPDGLHTEVRPWGKILYQLDPKTQQPVPPTDGLVVVVHGGIDIPIEIAGESLDQLINLSDDEAIENLAQTITDNKDVGVGLAINGYLKGMADGRYNKVAVVWVDPARVVGDYNRAKFAEQFPAQQYKGESPFLGELTASRFQLLREAIADFARELLALAVSAQTMVAVALHTYDVVSAGSNTVAQQYQVEQVGSEGETAPKKRPHVHLFSEFPDQDHPELLTAEQRNWLLSLVTHYIDLLLHEIPDEELAVAEVDTVYKAFHAPVTRLLEILNFVLIFIEFRKDIFDVTAYMAGPSREQEIARRGEEISQLIHEMLLGVRDPSKRAPLANHAF